ncbi:major facilitator superfamily domain-containing protein [Biscogniauxia mediterranea]|nr:major facilitator superfamily domain-containing protein [Biscogniauxia mediterranea]
MDSTLLKTLVQVESNSQSLPQAPQRVVSRTYPAVPQQQQQHDGVDAIELQSLRRPPKNDANANLPSGPTTPGDERDVEMSAPGSPAEQPGDVYIEALPSLTDPPMNRYRFATCCFQSFLGGLTDSAPGALIPYMEAYYNIGYAVVSLLFIGNAAGFILAAPLIDAIRQRLGRGRAMLLSQLCMGLGYVPLAAGAPFPAVVAAYFLIGFGFAVSLAIGNVFCANLRRGTTVLGFMHGSYGVGGTLGPLAATALVSSARRPWSRYYLLTLAIALWNAGFAAWSFWRYEEEAALAPATSRPQRTGAGNQVSALLGALRSRTVLLGALFIFAYQGAEVSISGWVISFLIATRDGDPSSVGYVTSGFWAGITLGRFALSPLGARVGEKRFVYLVVAGAAVFELLVWLVPNIVGEAVSLAVVGLLLGPVFPCAAALFTRNLSRQEQVSGLGLISAVGSSGGAIAPFTTGALAQAAGTFVMHPIAIGLFCVMMLTWFGQPSPRKRTE